MQASYRFQELLFRVSWFPQCWECCLILWGAEIRLFANLQVLEITILLTLWDPPWSHTTCLRQEVKLKIWRIRTRFLLRFSRSCSKTNLCISASLTASCLTIKAIISLFRKCCLRYQMFWDMVTQKWLGRDIHSLTFSNQQVWFLPMVCMSTLGSKELRHFTSSLWQLVLVHILYSEP
jgi:hypothetical protein